MHHVPNSCSCLQLIGVTEWWSGDVIEGGCCPDQKPANLSLAAVAASLCVRPARPPPQMKRCYRAQTVKNERREASRCLVYASVIGPRLSHRSSKSAQGREGNRTNRDIAAPAIRERFCFVRL